MAGNNVGFSFQPGSQQIPVGDRPQIGGGPQSAVQVKSFTLPNRAVPGQIAPQALLQSPGGGGQMDLTLLRQLMAAFAPHGQQPVVPTLGAPGQGMPPGMPGLSGMPMGRPSPFAGGPPTMPGPALSGSAPSPPRVIPSDETGGNGMVFVPPPPPPQAPPPLNIGAPSPSGFGPGGTIKSPLPGKFDWQNIQGLFE